MVMPQSKIFIKLNAFVGILGFVLLTIYEICSSFIQAFFKTATIFTMGVVLLRITEPL